MKYFIVALLLSSAGLAQIPGLGTIKDKLSGANSKVAPVTDRAQRAADTFTPWTSEEEQQIGLAGAEKMVAIFGLVDDPALEKYVNLVGLSVAQFASRDLPWRFGILNTNMVGAFALPGGYVFVTRGSLSGMTNEAQLAGVLGTRNRTCGGASSGIGNPRQEDFLLGRRRGSGEDQRAGGVEGSRADALVKDLFSTSLSRAKENDADEQGSRMAARAGYAGSGLLEFLKIASLASADPRNKRFFGQLLSTHPSFGDRIARLSGLDRRGQRARRWMPATARRSDDRRVYSPKIRRKLRQGVVLVSAVVAAGVRLGGDARLARLAGEPLVRSTCNCHHRPFARQSRHRHHRHRQCQLPNAYGQAWAVAMDPPRLDGTGPLSGSREASADPIRYSVQRRGAGSRSGIRECDWPGGQRGSAIRFRFGAY